MPPFTESDSLLFEQLRARLTAISARIVGNAAEAEDVVQDCYLKWQKVDRALVATPAAWLTTVVQRRSIDVLRRRQREQSALAQTQYSQDTLADNTAQSPEALLTRRAEVGEALARLFARLSRPERITLVLHEVLEHEHGDIATELATSAANARQLLLRARRRLALAPKEAVPGEPTASEKLCHELVRDFQAAINGQDRAAVLTLLGETQPVSVQAAPPPDWVARAAANDQAWLQLARA